MERPSRVAESSTLKDFADLGLEVPWRGNRQSLKGQQTYYTDFGKQNATSISTNAAAAQLTINHGNRVIRNCFIASTKDSGLFNGLKKRLHRTDGRKQFS